MAIYAVIDFETTGVSPKHGARPTEIAVVLNNGNNIIDRYQRLMNPGVPIADLAALAQLCRDRADSENTFDELKNQWGWGGFTHFITHN